MKLQYDRSKSHKTISVDFDDTLCITTTRDWENAEPKWDIINKVNNLYDEGWQILIITARGQLSCDGDTEKADKKYRKIIEGWLNKHSVKYHELKFEKYLASYYVDDKAINLDDFIDLEIKEIKTGWSGAHIEKRNDRIFKTHKDSIKAAMWYNMAAPLVNVPIVHSMIGETLCLDFLESNGSYFKIDELNSAIDKFSLYKMHNPFDLYIERIKAHIEHNNLFHEVIDLMEDKKVKDFCNQRSTFMHGDLSLENIIQTDNGLYFIDPIYEEKQWSSYLLDIAKMLHSYRKYNRMFEYEVFLNSWLQKDPSLDLYTIKLLELTQWIRVIKYVKDENTKADIINKTTAVFNDLKKIYVS